MSGKYSPYLMQAVRNAARAGRFTFASVFTGGGIADIGYALAGGRGIFGNEIKAEAVRTFRKNFADVAIEHADFRNVAASQETIDRLLTIGGLARGNLDVFHASPPCNEFSSLGRGPTRGGTWDLIFDVVRMVHVMRPRILVVENVPDLATRYRRVLNDALGRLRFGADGRRLYYADHLELSADNYGVPQRRRRLFVIAVRLDVATTVGINSDGKVLMLFPPPVGPPVTVEAALTELQQSAWQVHAFRRAMMSSSLGEIVPRLVPDPYRWMTFRKAGMGMRNYSTVRASLRLPSPTLTAQGQRPNGVGGVIHPTEHRKFTLPEMMRVTGMPDDYQFTGTLDQAVERVGMSVPPFVTKAIADDLYELVLLPYRRAGGLD